MKIFKTLTLCLVAVVFVVFGTGAGCSSKTATTSPTLTVWGFDDPDTFKPIIRDFEKNFSGVKINYVQKNLDANYELNSLNAISAGQGPDVWTIPNTWLLRHADKIVPYIPPKNTKADLDKIDPATYFLPVVVDNVTINSKIYGLTPYVDTLRIFYNTTLMDAYKEEFLKANKANKEYSSKIKTIIEKGPLFWDDIVELDKALTVKNGATLNRPIVALGTSNNISVKNDILYLIMLQNKTKFFSDDNATAIFNLPSSKATGETVVPAAKALDFYTSFANAADPNYTWNTAQQSDSDAFTAGSTLMTFNYQSYAEALGQRFPTFKYKQWPMPQILSSSNQEITDLARFNLMTVPSLSKNQANAWSFVKYTSTLGQSSYASTTKRAGSALKKGREVKVTERQGTAPDTLQKYTAQTMPQMSRFPDAFNANFAEAVANVNNAKMTSQQALDSISDKITQLLREKGY